MVKEQNTLMPSSVCTQCPFYYRPNSEPNCKLGFSVFYSGKGYHISDNCKLEYYSYKIKGTNSKKIITTKSKDIK